MRFDGNRAWQQAIRLFSANKELLLILAGVFFFLPGLASAFFLTDVQVQMVHDIGTIDPRDSKAMLTAVGGLYARIGPYVALLTIAQVAGTMAMMALLTDSARPTVGEAIRVGLSRLPTVLGVMLLLMLGYLLAALAFGLVLGLLAMVAGVAGGGSSAVMMAVVAVGMGGFMAFIIVAMTRLSVTLPVIVIEQVRGPLRALKRSWWLTKGNTGSLLGFYLVLMVAYAVIAMLLYMVLTALVALGTQQGSRAFYMASGVISGLIGGVVSVLATCIISAVHGQLAGPGRETIVETFR
ncbi:MAG: glycerophosphoryl diester phosphodiesterase membrane domain-containing protein [Sphingomonadales bacterium]|nr:glycerophosphoryl diester phosphodiesterase membrane domain-containing protein [Sphingomonadales bacterium]MDE2168195.1 glycerophosphoryl diester phosphodiesterase membrane domain-containing protein [Sphingomonadales bacterium]